ncbi:MAG: hypothetical protein ABSB19_02920 [Methylomonas sp.]|jgi:hypothetical protein
MCSRVFSETSAREESEALQRLEVFLEPRLEETKQSKFVDKSVMQIFEESLHEMR